MSRKKPDVMGILLFNYPHDPELYMGDELLKITGAGNLFMVFGEPDVIINKQKDVSLPLKSRDWIFMTRPRAGAQQFHK